MLERPPVPDALQVSLQKETAMADEPKTEEQGHLQTPGRKENAAQPLDAAKDNEGVERYPSTRKDDGIETRSFDPKAKDKSQPTSPNEGRLGPASDPAEGKRD
jgi:hypothetical protein